jgi:two-component system response regulator YesN
MQKMANMVGLSSVYLGALFKKKIGVSMNRYLINVRIKNAENMLRSGNYKVGEVVERCGYGDVFHFYKQFKTVMGISPSECIPKKNDF